MNQMGGHLVSTRGHFVALMETYAKIMGGHSFWGGHCPSLSLYVKWFS